MIYQVKRWDTEINKVMGDVYVVADNIKAAHVKGRQELTKQGYSLEDCHTMESIECPELCSCEVCGKIYDPKQLKRSQGDVDWLHKYCRAACYTKAMTKGELRWGNHDTGKGETPEELNKRALKEGPFLIIFEDGSMATVKSVDDATMEGWTDGLIDIIKFANNEFYRFDGEFMKVDEWEAGQNGI